MSVLQVKIARTAMTTRLKRQRRVMAKTLLRLSKAQLLRMFRKYWGQTQTNHIEGGARGLRPKN